MISIKPGDFHKFFADLEGDEKREKAVLARLMAQGLQVEKTDDTTAPEAAIGTDKIRREDLVTFAKILTALRAERPIKFTPDTKTQWTVHYGPKGG